MNKNTDDRKWTEAKRRCRLSKEEVRAAREMGLNPLRLIKNIPSPSERWKAPVADWIRSMYEKRYGRPLPGAPTRFRCPGGSGFQEPAISEAELYDDIFGYDDEPSPQEIEQANLKTELRQRNFRLAAEWVAREFELLPEVRKVVLFGSVAVRLTKELPRIKRFRRAGVAIWHECKDIDLAVWVSSLERLEELQRAGWDGVSRFHAATRIGIEPQQVDVVLMEPGTDRYLGRLCWRKACPKGKPECKVRDCGRPKWLKQRPGFEWRASALAPERAVTLFDRDGTRD